MRIYLFQIYNKANVVYHEFIVKSTQDNVSFNFYMDDTNLVFNDSFYELTNYLTKMGVEYVCYDITLILSKKESNIKIVNSTNWR